MNITKQFNYDIICFAYLRAIRSLFHEKKENK